jgi:hypothetical protein
MSGLSLRFAGLVSRSYAIEADVNAAHPAEIRILPNAALDFSLLVMYATD